MSFSEDNPWAKIPKASSGQFSRIRVNQDTPAIFWIRDENNRPGIIIELSRRIPRASLREANINILNISIDIQDIADYEPMRILIIRLENYTSVDVFLKLCLDLIEKVDNSNDANAVFSSVCKRLKSWQLLFSRKTKPLLSHSEIQGLFSELYFILENLKRSPTLEIFLINGWEGPRRTQHDFVLLDTAIEIKSLAGNDRAKVRISSEDQLHSHMKRIFLHVYLLSNLEDKNDGISLNRVVSTIVSMLTTQEGQEIFQQKLALARYIDIPDYDVPRFRVHGSLSYLVAGEFPRLTREDLPQGIEDVSYDLVLASLEPFKVYDIDLEE